MSAITISGRRDADEDGRAGWLYRIGWLFYGFGQAGCPGGTGAAGCAEDAEAGGTGESPALAEQAVAYTAEADADVGEADYANGTDSADSTDTTDSVNAAGTDDAQAAHSVPFARSTRSARHGHDHMLRGDTAHGLDLDAIRADGAVQAVAVAYAYLPDRAEFVIGPSLADQLSAVLARVWAMVRRWDKTTRLLAGSAVALVPWIIVLGLTLPTHTVARNWSTVWIGFDLLLAVAFGATARLYLRDDPRVGIMAAVVATLLIVDCWFDTSTASDPRDAIESWVLAIFIEIPIAVFCARLAWRSSLSMVGPPQPTDSAESVVAVVSVQSTQPVLAADLSE